MPEIFRFLAFLSSFIAKSMSLFTSMSRVMTAWQSLTGMESSLFSSRNTISKQKT